VADVSSNVVTQLLVRWRNGDGAALQQLVAIVDARKDGDVGGFVDQIVGARRPDGLSPPITAGFHTRPSSVLI
jgi:hypothetical protein